jgi:hypothetical protein
MLTGSTFSTAILRGFYVAVVSGLIAGLTLYMTDSDGRKAILSGLLTGLGALGVRGGIEGGYDATRQANNKVNTADVQGVPPGQP